MQNCKGSPDGCGRTADTPLAADGAGHFYPAAEALRKRRQNQKIRRHYEGPLKMQLRQECGVRDHGY